MAAVDDAVDEQLGDEIELAIDGISFSKVKAFVFGPGSEIEIDFAPINPIEGRPRLKISKAVLSEPSKTNRFKVPQLENPDLAMWRPENWAQHTSGRYWMIDIQKAVT